MKIVLLTILEAGMQNKTQIPVDYVKFAILVGDFRNLKLFFFCHANLGPQK